MGRNLLQGCRQCLVLIHTESPPSQLSSGAAQPQGTTSQPSACVIPGTGQSLLLSVLTPGRRPPTRPSAPAFQREALSTAPAKSRGDLMRQQTGREIFSNSSKHSLATWLPGDRDRAQVIFCHPSLLGGDLWAQNSCL